MSNDKRDYVILCNVSVTGEKFAGTLPQMVRVSGVIDDLKAWRDK